MLTDAISVFLNSVLRLRYRIRVHGLEEILKKEKRKMLFLPNHPALIDPTIISSVLLRHFHPYILVDEEQVRETALKNFVKELKLLPIPDIGISGGRNFDVVEKQLKVCVDELNSGENVLMYPSGRVYRSRFETLQGKFGASHLITQCKDARIILIRTTGLWGSSFSHARGYALPFSETLHENFKYLLKNLIFFSPRRTVDITFQEAGPDLPRSGTKEEINRYLENFYNADAPFNTYVPYTWWEKGGVRTMPEPPAEDLAGDTKDVPENIRKKVYAKLCEKASVTEVHDQDKLGTDLGMDSLMIYELAVWVQEEFGYTVSTPDSLKRVSDILLATIGQTVHTETLRPVPAEWFIPADRSVLKMPQNCTRITDAFLKHAAQNPDHPLLADQRTGVLTNRKIILAILALKSVFSRLPGERIGIIMPSCAPFFIVYMSALFSGKTPVILNWTVGPRNLESCVRRSGITHILSSKLVIEQLEGSGTDFSGVRDKFLYLEELKKEITLTGKIMAFLRLHFSWHTLYSAKVPEISAILFTSGSESEPKAVPLTHQNSIYDLAYAIKPMNLTRDQRVLAMLPPFHSFGLLIGAMLPALLNIQTVYHSNPTEGNLLARLIGAYRATLIVGTPTFVGGILKNAETEDVKTIRLIITGAEKCPQHVLDLCRSKCASAEFLEGYGITECGPIVSLNQPGAAKYNTIGHVLECLDWMICDDKMQKLPSGETGMLYVSGPTIFKGYLAYDGASPFVELDGKQWYRTGDLVQADDEGYITFMGRLKRFIKVAGEMVSLPAIEEVLLAHYKNDEVPVPLAVEAHGPDSAPEIVLFTTIDLEKNAVNQQIREAGFSPIHYVKKIVKLDAIPLLGSGKTDYRQLKKLV